ncbi:Copine_I [Hexamita inflata]|uniref:Copine I n=1 Tax=Hexamita inflata TaxID=28002 RepID=A0AA86USW8_9EUKA|nr:Copine I [Hexamita inflata]
MFKRKSNKENHFKSYEEFKSALIQSGYQKSQIIFAIDFSSSNATSGKYHYKEGMHNIKKFTQTPYERAILCLQPLFDDLDVDSKIPCFIFGDTETRDQSVRPLSDDIYLNGVQEVIKNYRQVCQRITMHGPTTLKPIISEAIKIMQYNKNILHILVILTDGEVSNPEIDAEYIIKASEYPLSIVTVGLGDGPFDDFEKFDDRLRKRKFDNFNFVDYTELESNLKDAEILQEKILVQLLHELPEQLIAINKLKLLTVEK